MSFFVSTSASITAGSKIVVLTGTPDLSMIRRSDALFIGGTGPYEVDFPSVSVGGARSIHLMLPVDTAFTDTRCVVVPTAGDFVTATMKIREVSEFGVNVFSSLSRWATDEVPSIEIQDAAGTIHNVPTIWFLTANASSLVGQTQALKDTVNLLTPLVNALNQNYQTLAPAVSQSLQTATTLKDSADAAITTVNGLLSQATQARAGAEAALASITPKHNDVSGWYTLIAGYENSYTQKHAESVQAAGTATTRAAEALASRNQASNFAADADADRAEAQTHRNNAEGFRNEALGFRNTAETHRNAAASSATAAQTAEALAKRWASDPEGTIVADGLESARSYAIKAANSAQQTAANIAGGMSFRGFHNPASGFPANADTGHQFKLTGSATLTFEGDGSKAVTAGDYIIKTASGWVHLDDATDSVKNTRRINGYTIAGDISLNASDVGARATSWVPSWLDVSGKPTTLAGYGITDAVPSSRTVNGRVLTANIALTAADVGAVPDTRTVNGRALSSNIALTPGDVGAVPSTRTVNGKALTADVTLTPADIGTIASNDSRLTDAREWSANTVTQVDAEAGTSTSRFAWTPERVRQAAIAANAAAIEEAAGMAIIFGG